MYGRGPEKIPEAGAHREISRFPGGPVRHWVTAEKGRSFSSGCRSHQRFNAAPLHKSFTRHDDQDI